MSTLIFISHKETDAPIADLLVNLLHSSLQIKEDEIRCTSVIGHKLDFSEYIPEQLRTEIGGSIVIYALLTKQSLESKWVLFELGASWALGKLLIPVLGPGLSHKDLPGPLKGYPCVEIGKEDASDRIFDAVGKSAEKLNIELIGRASARARKDVNNFVDACRGNAGAFYSMDVEKRTVKFVCKSQQAVNAEDVYVAGTFNEWLNACDGKIEPNELFRLDKVTSEGLVHWEKEIPIPIGPHDFKFVVGRNFWIHWSEESGYPKASDAPGGNNFHINVA